MSDKPIPVNAGSIEGGNEIEQKYCRALLINKSACALDGYKIEVI
jgi:hypothetical protein